MRFNIRILLIGVIAVALIHGCGDEQKGNDASSARHAPHFALKSLKGNTLNLEDLRGKVVLLNFFATWCPPCRQEIPDFVRLYEKFKDKGLEIVGIALDMQGAAVLTPFVKHFKISYPVLLGTRKVVMDYGGIEGIPTTFFIDRDGFIAEHFVGLRPAMVLEKTITELIDKSG